MGSDGLANHPHRASVPDVTGGPHARHPPRQAMAYVLLSRRHRPDRRCKHCHRRSRPRAAPPGRSLEAFSRTEKVIAFCRVLLAVATLARRHRRSEAAVFCARRRAIVVLWRLRRLQPASSSCSCAASTSARTASAYLSAAADIVWVTVITLFTERGATPFFLLNLFVISSVSVRWGFAAARAGHDLPGRRATRLLIFVASRCRSSATSRLPPRAPLPADLPARRSAT